VLPDCKALPRVFISVAISVEELPLEELSEEELSCGGGGGGEPWAFICCPSWASTAEKSICEKISSTLELLWEVVDEVVDEAVDEVADEEVPDDASWLS